MEIESILERVHTCRECKSMFGYKKFPLHSHGNSESKYMLVSEAPGKESLNNEKYWTRVGGRILREAIAAHKKELEELFYLTDIVKCWPCEDNRNRTPLQSEIENCKKWFDMEIEVLKPELILALGKMSAELLLNESITMKEAHGKVFIHESNTKVLVLYHPSNIDFFMKREVYILQLKNVFGSLIKSNLENLESNLQKIQSLSEKQKNKTFRPGDSTTPISFTLPAPGNSITETDITKHRLRITVDFKSYFPDQNARLTFEYFGQVYQVSFIHKGNRSYLLNLGKALSNKLALIQTSKLKFTRKRLDYYVLEKV